MKTKDSKKGYKKTDKMIRGILANRVSYNIVDNEGSIVKSYPPKTRKKPGSSSVEVGGINTTGFEDGQYYLNVSIRDNNTGEQIDKMKEFFVFKSITTEDKNFKRVYSLQERIAFEEEQINDLNDQEIAGLFDNMKLILTNEDKNAFKMYRFPEKKRFIAVFWANNDPILSTLANELKADYFSKINYSNEKFTAARRA